AAAPPEAGPKPAPAAKAAAPAPAPRSSAAPAGAPEVELEIDLEEGEDLTQLVAQDEEEEELVVEGEEEIPEVPAEPTSVEEARASVSRGAAAAAAAYLEDRLGANPGDVAAWEVLAEARRALGSPKAARDALLRLADVHRRARRFDEARAAYKGALDLDHRSAAAARGLAQLIIEEEESQLEQAPPVPAARPVPPAAEPPAAPTAPAPAEELIEISLEDEGAAEAAPVPPPAPPPAEEAVPAATPVAAPVAAAPEVAETPYGEISIEGAAPAEAPVAPEQEFGEISLEELAAAPAAGAPSPEQDAIPEGDIFAEETFAPEAAEHAAVPHDGPPDEISLEEAPFEVGAEEVALEHFDAAADALSGAAPGPAPGALPEPAPEGIVETVFEPASESPAEVAFAPVVEAPVVEAPVVEAPAVEAPVVEAPAEKRGAAPVGGEFAAFLAEADFYLQQGLLDEAESLYSKLAKLAPGNASIAANLQAVRERRAAAPPASVAAAAAAAPSAPAEAEAPPPVGADFGDFLGDLRLEFEGQGELAPPPPLDEAGLNEIFQEFQRSVKEQLGDEDFETHYNLGIAYKEMGLTEEAIGEFTLAEKSPSRAMDAVSMIALCLREQGRADEAAQKLRTGIALAVEGSEQQKGFLYDLAALHEQAGRTDLAGEALQRLHAIDPAYRDVAARIGGAPPPAAHPRKKPRVSYL
ncbi:MAG TPA: tetratricopeptide repeat protein, partial [bacterium]